MDISGQEDQRGWDFKVISGPEPKVLDGRLFRLRARRIDICGLFLIFGIEEKTISVCSNRRVQKLHVKIQKKTSIPNFNILKIKQSHAGSRRLLSNRQQWGRRRHMSAPLRSDAPLFLFREWMASRRYWSESLSSPSSASKRYVVFCNDVDALQTEGCRIPRLYVLALRVALQVTILPAFQAFPIFLPDSLVPGIRIRNMRACPCPCPGEVFLHLSCRRAWIGRKLRRACRQPLVVFFSDVYKRFYLFVFSKKHSRQLIEFGRKVKNESSHMLHVSPRLHSAPAWPGSPHCSEPRRVCPISTARLCPGLGFGIWFAGYVLHRN